MYTKKVLGTILVLIVIVYVVSGLKGLSKNNSKNSENSGTQVQNEIAISKLTNQLVYNGQNTDIKVVDVNGMYYFPLIDLGKKLNFNVDINENGILTIKDGRNSTEIKSDTTVFVNGEEHNKAVNFHPVNSYLVPEDFVKTIFGVEIDYKIDEEKNIKYFYMTGRNTYEVNQTDVDSPHLYMYTNEGLRDLGLISDKKDLVIEKESQLTKIESVARTEKSDIITTKYTYEGAVTSSYPNVLYVREGDLIDKSNLKTNSYIAGETVEEAPTLSHDNRIALLSEDAETGNTIIRIYDDASGTLLSERDTVIQYGGHVYNIQAVGRDFIVVGMYKPLNEDTYNTYYTAIINLNTNQVIPVYEKFVQAEALKNIGMEDNAVNYINSKMVPYDGIIFNFIADDGSLKFSTHNGEVAFENLTTEYVNITLEK